MTLDTAAKLSIGLGVLSLAAVVVAHLALTDIWHGEADVRLEWRALQLCAAVILASQIFTLTTLGRVVRKGAGRA